MLHCTTTHQTHYHMLRDMIYPLRRLLMTLFFLICLCACLGCGSYGYRRYRRTSLPASYIVARGPGESHSHVPFHCQAIMVLLSPSSSPSPSPLLHLLCVSLGYGSAPTGYHGFKPSTACTTTYQPYQPPAAATATGYHNYSQTNAAAMGYHDYQPSQVPTSSYEVPPPYNPNKAPPPYSAH